MKKSAKEKVEKLLDEQILLSETLLSAMDKYPLETKLACLIGILSTFCAIQENPAEIYKFVIKRIYEGVQLQSDAYKKYKPT